MRVFERDDQQAQNKHDFHVVLVRFILAITMQSKTKCFKKNLQHLNYCLIETLLLSAFVIIVAQIFKFNQDFHM